MWNQNQYRNMGSFLIVIMNPLIAGSLNGLLPPGLLLRSTFYALCYFFVFVFVCYFAACGVRGLLNDFRADV